METPAGSPRRERGAHGEDGPLRIGLLAPPWVPVPPTVYGGTELVIEQLALGLTQAGCEVLLFTTGDSTCPVERRWLYPRALGTAADLSAEAPHVARGYRELAAVDLIHDHTLSGPRWGIDHHCPVPIVTTIHGELTPAMLERYQVMAAGGVTIITVSSSQRSTAPDLPVAAVIHHGIDVTDFPVGRGDGGYVLFLGRMHPQKGVHRAIEVARTAGKRILLTAKMWEPEELQYFADVVEPLLGPDATYLGEVSQARKLELLGGAEALVNPIRWPEPFGLVMIEALACGTPVLTFREGAAPEIVEHGQTGFLCADEADMVASLGRVGTIDRARCRQSVVDRFSVDRMVADHLELYRHVLRATASDGFDPDGPAARSELDGGLDAVDTA